jgi:hypothetical protein
MKPMNLLITKGECASVWVVEDDQRATRLHFTKFDERDLCTSKYDLRQKDLPIEVVETILMYAYYDYMRTWNFDLCCELLIFSKSFTRVLYREIYGSDQGLSYFRMYSRLCRTFAILENIYEEYLSQPSVLKYACAKLTSMRHRGYNHQPWDFLHNIVLTPIIGMVVDLTETQLQFNYGKHYGEQVWVSGQYYRQMFRTERMKTPVINLMFVDVFDTLIHSCDSFNDNYVNFFRLVKLAFGVQTGLFVMVREDHETNPFITRSDLFLEL